MAKLNDKNERPAAADGSWSIDLNFDEPAAPEAPAEKKPAEPVTDDVFAFDIPEDVPAAPEKVPEPPKKPEPPVRETPKAAAEKKPEPAEAKDDTLTVDELLASFAPVKAAPEESEKIEAGADDVHAEISVAEPAAEEVPDTEPTVESVPEEKKTDAHSEKEKTALFAGMAARRKARDAAVVKPLEKKTVDESSRKYLVRTVAVLTGICTGVALLLAVIHGATQSVIAQNVEREKNEAILAVFPEGNDIREYENEDGEKVYIVLRDGTIVGYCVNTV
ncbi:MAG: hypothetical protein IKZ41_02830, partial [Clostridia bacterium]|nr:hypothetical protein [Clostridia bacterium]